MGIPRKKILIAVVATLLIGGGVFAYWQISRGDNANPADNQQNKNGQQSPDNQPREVDKPKPDGTPASNGGTSNNSPSQGSVTVTVTYASGSDDPIIVTATVDGATSGTCTAVFSRMGQASVQENASLNRVTNYYACQISIAKSRFPVRGEWEVQVNFTGDNKQGTSTSKAIDIQ